MRRSKRKANNTGLWKGTGNHMEETVLKVENISKNFGMTQALKDVNFSIRKGTIHSLLRY